MLEFVPRDYFHHACFATIFLHSFHSDSENSHLHGVF